MFYDYTFHISSFGILTNITLLVLLFYDSSRPYLPYKFNRSENAICFTLFTLIHRTFKALHPLQVLTEI